MPIDSASSSPSSRRTIIVRLAHGHARPPSPPRLARERPVPPVRRDPLVQVPGVPYKLSRSAHSPDATSLLPFSNTHPYPGLPDAVPEDALVSGRIVGHHDGIAQQAGGAAPHVVTRPSGVAAGDEVHPHPVGPVRHGRR